jgi:mannose-6-phosphate isomerase-like protein (cupin superfamily)
MLAEEAGMAIFDLSELRAARERGGGLYHEFLRVPDLSAGLYVLAVGGADPQRPHTEDEIYYIVAGRGAIQIGDDSFPVQAGSVVFVPSGVVHRFHTIAEELSILVVFGPAEYSRRTTSATAASTPD